MVKTRRVESRFHKRIVVLTVFLCACFGIIVLRLASLQIVSGKEYQALAENQYQLFKVITPVRGEIKITDKSSPEPVTVATSVQKDLVYAIPTSIKDDNAFAQTLAPVLGLQPEDILSKISDKTKKYAALKKQLTDDEEQKIKDLHLAGIAFEPETIRFYPQGQLLSNVLGYVGYKGDNKTGIYGLEQYFNDELAGQAGSLDQEKDATGSWIFGTKRNIKPATNGTNIVLTIDKSIQFKAEQVIDEAVQKHGADGGSVIIMDPKTGAILAMASYPTFDPNSYSKNPDQKNFANLNISNYEPGSVFKAITMAASIDEGKVTPDTTYVDTGHVNVDGYDIQNSDLKAHGVQTMTQVLEQSLNTGAIFAKEQIGNSDFLKYVDKFGFGAKTNIELPESKGDLANLLQGDIKVNYDTAAFGQGISVTPLQLIRAYGALANGGKMMQPYLVQSYVDPSGKVSNTSPKQAGQPVSGQTASMITAMLINVVENGHGKKAAVPGFWVAGKTGTAQVPNKGKPGYEANNNIGTFAGYAPADDPKFVMVVRVDHPRDVSFAESSAAPAWGELAQFMLNYYNVAPNRK